jgi:hypothetical protein
MVVQNHSFTCPNPSCGKVFANPLKAENLCAKEAQPYDACPYCLTEIVIDASSLAIKEEPKPEIKRIENEEHECTTAESTARSASASQCSHQLGFLSKRPPKEKIPEECIMCSSIVQCMLKNITE